MASSIGRDRPTSSQRSASRKSLAHMPSPSYMDPEDKENMTADVGAIAGLKRSSRQGDGPYKKLRSKSIGPGGLDALKEKSTDQRKRIPELPIKSILKPTIPLSPLREIPSQRTLSEGLRLPGSQKSSKSVNSANASENNLLIDSSIHHEPVSVSGGEKLHNPFSEMSNMQGEALPDISTSKINGRVPDAEQKDKDLREKERKEILERREARRKSLANRRVSFAPEATLHTWNVVEFVQDLTTSSASTNSTQQASTLSTPPPDAAAASEFNIPGPRSDLPELALLSPQEADDTVVQGAPANEGDGHRRKRRRRSLDTTPRARRDENEILSSSPFSGSSARESDESFSEITSEVDEGDSANSPSESAGGDSTSMSLDDVDETAESLVATLSSNPSTASTSRLDEALRQAALQAGTQGIEYDEYGDLSMEIASDHITAAFQSWSKYRGSAGQRADNLTASQDQENQNPFSPPCNVPVFRDAYQATVRFEEDCEADMEITRPVGKILASHSQSDTVGEVDMEMTRPMGKILATHSQADTFAEVEMDMTGSVGKILASHSQPVDIDEVDMDITRPVGKILAFQPQLDGADEASLLLPSRPDEPPKAGPSPQRSSLEGSSLGDGTMDLTMTIGGISDEPDHMDLSEQEGDENFGPAGPVMVSATATGPIQSKADRTELAINTPEHVREPMAFPSTQSPANDQHVASDGSISYPQDVFDPNRTNGQTSPTPKAVAEQRIRLQEFLKLTGIHFMDLTATKRKHHKISGLPGPVGKGSMSSMEGNTNLSEIPQSHLEQHVRAACCILPMLDMYQHSCRELKKSISEGRSIIRQIETDTYAENPSLFREYISASPAIRLIMDNQFKNVKTYARLSSKAMWYDWRKKLLDDLGEGLRRIHVDMKMDDDMLVEYEKLLSTLLPRLLAEQAHLREEQARLRAHADEIAKSNQKELGTARSKLLAVKKEIEHKKQLTQQRQMQVREKQEAIEAAIEQKMVLVEDIKQAEKITEECRGWTTSEVSMHKGIADKLERKHGWAITGVHGRAITMTFQQDLQVVLHTSCLMADRESESSALSHGQAMELTYLEAERNKVSSPQRSIRRVFAQAANGHVARHRPRNTTELSETLASVSDLWGKASLVAEEFRLLSLHFPTDVTECHEGCLSLRSSVLLPSIRTKIHVVFDVSLPGPGAGAGAGVPASVSVRARAVVVYGEPFASPKMQDFLARRVHEGLSGHEDYTAGEWSAAVRALCEKLTTQGKSLSSTRR